MTLEEMIRRYINYQQNNWDELFPGLEHAYNSSVHATTGLAPFYDDVWSDFQNNG
jgi:hypothetical protein